MKRGQQVWVKVLSIAGSRLSLSMRDVDQDTGKDLLPGAKIGAGAGQEQRPGTSGLHGLSGIRVQVSFLQSSRTHHARCLVVSISDAPWLL